MSQTNKDSLFEYIDYLDLDIQNSSSDNLLWDKDAAELICILRLVYGRYRICCNEQRPDGDDSGSPFSNNSDTIAENHDVKADNISDIFLKYLIILSFGFVAVLLLVIGKKEMHRFQKHKAFDHSTC